MNQASSSAAQPKPHHGLIATLTQAWRSDFTDTIFQNGYTFNEWGNTRHSDRTRLIKSVQKFYKLSTV